MAAPFQLTEDATRDLERTVDYVSQHSIFAAQHLADDLEEAFRFLSQWPEAGSRREPFIDAPVRFWNTSGYSIAYMPDRTPLLVIAVIHGSRDAAAAIDFRLSKHT